MHPTADTTVVIYFQRLGAAGDAGFCVAGFTILVGATW